MAPVAAWLASTVTVAGVTLTVGTVLQVGLVVSSALYAQQRQKAAREAARRAFNASLTDSQQTIRSGVAPRTFTYGRDKVSGPIVFAHSSGSKKEFLHLVIPVAGHEFDGFEKYFFNEIELPAPDGSGFITSGEFARIDRKSTTFLTPEFITSGTTQTLAHTPVRIISVTRRVGTPPNATYTTLTSPADYTISGNVITYAVDSGRRQVQYEWEEVTPRVRIKAHLGGAGQVADADLIAESGGKWTSAHVGNGIPYVYVRLEYDRQVFGQIGVPNISVVGRGKKVLDTRTSTIVWTDNNALCVADYMRDATLGMGCSSAQVPAAEVSAEANICDEDVAIDASTNQKRYTFNGTLSTGTGRKENLETLLLPMAGTAVWVQGRWFIRAGAHRSSEFTLDESWLTGTGPVIVPKAPRRQLFNAVSGRIVDAAQNYGEVQYPEVANATYKAQDGNRRILKTIDMPGVKDSKRAQRLAKIALERARLAQTVRVVCNMRGYDTLPTQVGTVNLARYGYSGFLYEVRQRELDLERRTVTLTLRRAAAGAWNWNYGEANTLPLAPATTLPSWSAAPAELLGLAADSTSAVQLESATGAAVLRAKLTWTQSSDIFVVRGGRIEIEYAMVDGPDWQAVPPVPGDATTAFVSPLEQLGKTLFRIRAVNASGRVGIWSYILHTPQSAVSLRTEQLGANSAADRIIGTLDTATYAGAFSSPLPGQLVVTPPHAAKATITVSAEITATNTSGSAKKIALRYYPAVSIGGGGSDQGVARWAVQAIGNGDTFTRQVLETFEYDLTAGVAYTLYLWYSDHTSATQGSELTNIKISADLRYR